MPKLLHNKEAEGFFDLYENGLLFIYQILLQFLLLLLMLDLNDYFLALEHQFIDINPLTKVID